MQPFACVCIPCVTLTASSNSPATSDNRPPQPLRNNHPEESFVDQHHNMRQGAAACNDANFVQSGVQGDFGAGQSLYWNSSQEDMQADWYEPIALQEDEAPERWRPMQYYHDDHADQHVLLAADNDDSAIHSDTDSNCFRL
ncbi:hypothetical protein AaE_001863 [Aphanomyces astaci]|uniref:Uncharacterized protein n=1 Tax=Aphanomyces astaci TaxID=112090 RepID=A0A6A5AVK1_APHAT|nr:hypothetical protein AaE_001863 [Aphanomyces astaci]